MSRPAMKHPTRKPGIPGPPAVETAAQQLALAFLEENRKEQIDAARAAALDLIGRHPEGITSLMVFRELDRLGKLQPGLDPRWMGAVFQGRRLWRKVGYVNDGSHGRPIPVWKLKGGEPWDSWVDGAPI